MARVRTLAELRTEVRQRADVENATAFLPDSEVNRYINGSIAELYDLLLDNSSDDFYLNSSDQVTTPGSEFVALPNDMYLLRGVDLVEGDVLTTLRPFNFRDRNAYRDSVLPLRINTEPYEYRMMGVTSSTTGAYTPLLYLIPTPVVADTIRIWYVPHAPVLDSDTDVWDGFNGWEEFVVLDAAIKCLEKEESDTTTLERRLAKVRDRIITLARDRDITENSKIQDVEDLC